MHEMKHASKLVLTPARIQLINREAPDWIRAVQTARTAKRPEVLTHYTTFGGNPELLQSAIVYADRYGVRVIFVTTDDAFRLQSDDHLAGHNMHHNAMPAEDFRSIVIEGRNGKRPQS